MRALRLAALTVVLQFLCFAKGIEVIVQLDAHYHYEEFTNDYPATFQRNIELVKVDEVEVVLGNFGITETENLMNDTRLKYVAIDHNVSFAGEDTPTEILEISIHPAMSQRALVNFITQDHNDHHYRDDYDNTYAKVYVLRCDYDGVYTGQMRSIQSSNLTVSNARGNYLVETILFPPTVSGLLSAISRIPLEHSHTSVIIPPMLQENNLVRLAIDGVVNQMVTVYTSSNVLACTYPLDKRDYNIDKRDYNIDNDSSSTNPTEAEIDTVPWMILTFFFEVWSNRLFTSLLICEFTFLFTLIGFSCIYFSSNRAEVQAQRQSQGVATLMDGLSEQQKREKCLLGTSMLGSVWLRDLSFFLQECAISDTPWIYNLTNICSTFFVLLLHILGLPFFLLGIEARITRVIESHFNEVIGHEVAKEHRWLS